MKHYLIVVWNDITVEVLGPYKTDAAVLRAARNIRARSDEHGVHWLDINPFGVPTVGDFSNRQMES